MSRRILMALALSVSVSLSLSVSFSSLADTFRVTSEVSLQGEVLGAPTLVIDKAEAERVMLADKYQFSVKVTSHDAAQVLVDFSLSGEGYETESQAIVDLDKAALLTFGDQTFSFLINRVGD
ncbi:hypothetical protein K0I63_00320 [Shewanella rhizosphaerae]|uniref:hypothetical protein n=1 Tax=Shewanella rhizosphaerae TaxID=2864207 RepID=UPI001C6621F0|nr:hypothetical protein [Shewanella rhizosphaerae]QYK13016.1 hypothetical protein K0I63_00320 [Shewanella rhizosphaerae]